MKKLCLISALIFGAALGWAQNQADARRGEALRAGFIRVERGTFNMGGVMYGNEQPVHEVMITKAFYISDHEVTQREWVEVMGENPSRFKGDDLPVERVSWYDAVEYCNKRSEREGLTPVYVIDKTRKDGNNKSANDDFKWTVTWNKNTNGYRLPTEAEWEFAAQGGVLNKGWEYSGAAYVDGVAWYMENSRGETQPVKIRSPNELGVFDMSGNVAEWCWDWSGSYEGGTQTDPEGALAGARRIYRGGSWLNGVAALRTMSRYGDYPSGRGGSIGLRLVRP
jgi:formylglycine-generating enzyme required for sulfatase activity